jgi:hypothetical protein
MSEYLDRNQFGPIQVTIDSMTPQGVNLRFESVEGEFTATSTEGQVSVLVDVNPFHVAEMFNWLYLALFRLQAIKNTMDVVEPEIRRRVQRMVDEAFANKSYSLRDMDHVSFQAQQHENQDRPQIEKSEATHE